MEMLTFQPTRQQALGVRQSTARLVKLLGATPVTLPYEEAGAGLKDGRIDCAENNLPSYESTGNAKVAKFVHLSNHSVTPEALVMSINVWNQLKPEDQKHVQDAGRKSAIRMRELWTRRVEEARANAVTEGSQFTRMTDHAPFIVHIRPLLDGYIANPATRGELFIILAN